MAHVTFYRKYRSRSFDEIVGQENVIQTLKNAITNDRISHAYIFSGPRGTGKTSMARIMAKALNCRKGPSGSPCLECDLCRKISSGQSVDVIEIDAASNTGVDNIRSLNEQVNFAPVECLYKMYIIDEAHMLSIGAFNALLKTMEEPPSKTIFILATTEPQKIPITIHSRCQKMNFRTLSISEIQTQLRYIATQENMSIPDDGLRTIARNSSGCMRDAISLLDQVYSFKGQEVSHADVIAVLGSSNADELLVLVESLIKHDAETLVKQVTMLLDSGLNILQLIQDMSDILRQLVFMRMGLTQLVDSDESQKSRLSQIAQLKSASELQQMLEYLARLEQDLKTFSNPALLLQVKLLQLVNPATVAPPQAPSPGSMTVSSAPAPSPASAVASSVPAPNPASAARVSMPTQSQAPAPVKSVQAASVPTASAPAQTAPLSSQAPAKTTGGASEKWHPFLAELKKQNPAIYTILTGSNVVAQSATVITVKLRQDFKFFREKLAEQKSQDVLQKIAETIFGSPFKILANSDELAKTQAASNTAVSNGPSTIQNTSTNQGNSIVNDRATAPVHESTTAAASISVQESPNKDEIEQRKINQIVSMFDGTLIN